MHTDLRKQIKRMRPKWVTIIHSSQPKFLKIKTSSLFCHWRQSCRSILEKFHRIRPIDSTQPILWWKLIIKRAWVDNKSYAIDQWSITNHLISNMNKINYALINFIHCHSIWHRQLWSQHQMLKEFLMTSDKTNTIPFSIACRRWVKMAKHSQL